MAIGLGMTFPESVRIACFDFRVESWRHAEAVEAKQDGDFSFEHQCIRIDDYIAGWKLVEILIHEIGHGIWACYGLKESDSEEHIVTMMAIGWTQVFRDNPELVAFLHERTATNTAER